mmetsp:Transcript_6302/g.15200  ORF Transcript_6302/g.15200 Transcript_6302/m.15200 type:complete len:204 (-) Transcript_6302:314-925(-)
MTGGENKNTGSNAFQHTTSEGTSREILRQTPQPQPLRQLYGRPCWGSEVDVGYLPSCLPRDGGDLIAASKSGAPVSMPVSVREEGAVVDLAMTPLTGEPRHMMHFIATLLVCTRMGVVGRPIAVPYAVRPGTIVDHIVAASQLPPAVWSTIDCAAGVGQHLSHTVHELHAAHFSLASVGFLSIRPLALIDQLAVIGELYPAAV